MTIIVLYTFIALKLCFFYQGYSRLTIMIGENVYIQPWLYILLFIKKGFSFIDNFQGCLYLLGHMFMLHNLPSMCSSSPTNFHTIHDGDVLLYFIRGPYLDLLFLLETFKCIYVHWGTFLSVSNSKKHIFSYGFTGISCLHVHHVKIMSIQNYL